MNREHVGALPWLDMPDETFFSFDEDAQNRLEDRLLLTSSWGVAIRSPRAVDLLRNRQIPLLVLSHSLEMRDWEIQDRFNRVLVSSDLVNGGCSAYWISESKKRLDVKRIRHSGKGDPPDQPGVQLTFPFVKMLDVQNIAVPPLGVGRYAFTVLVHDWRSNTTVVEVSSGGQSVKVGEYESLRYRRDEAVRLLASIEGDATATSQRLRLGATVETPPVEGPEGMAFIVPPRSPAVVAAIPIHGRVKAELLWGSMVEPGSSAPGEAVPSAVIKLGVVLTGLDQMRPIATAVPIPVVGLLDPKPGDKVEAAFSLDLAAILGGGIPVGIYQVYFTCGKQVAGPYPLRVEGR